MQCRLRPLSSFLPPDDGERVSPCDWTYGNGRYVGVIIELVNVTYATLHRKKSTIISPSPPDGLDD